MKTCNPNAAVAFQLLDTYSCTGGATSNATAFARSSGISLSTIRLGSTDHAGKRFGGGALRQRKQLVDI